MDIYELIGFIIGDGNIYYNKSKKIYRLELCGNADEDYDYFVKICDFLTNYLKKKPKLFIRNELKGKSVRIQINNKNFVEYLHSFGLPYGKKTFTIVIPDNLLKKETMFSILRGLFEADGCFYFSKSKKGDFPTYPRLEIRSSSSDLVLQIKNFLESQEFIVYIKNPRSDRTFSIVLSGEKMLDRWIENIRFAGLKNITKYQIWKSKGFYTPNTPLNKRLLICGDGTAATAVDFSRA